MLVIVRERTKEIGIRKSVGATPGAVMGQVILEAAILTSAAGYLGLIAGMGILDLAAYLLERSGMETMMFRDPSVGLATAFQAFAVLVVSGALAGLVPAQRAVRVRPVEALRIE